MEDKFDILLRQALEYVCQKELDEYDRIKEMPMTKEFKEKMENLVRLCLADGKNPKKS